MSKKHLIIKDADEDIEYDVEEVTEEPLVEEKEEEIVAEEHPEEVCPECGKNPCECESAKAAAFTEEEIAALKELISIVPELKKLLEAKPEEKPAEPEKVEEHEEIKEIEEIEEPEDESKEEESEEEPEDEPEEEESEEDESVESITDSVGSLETTVGDGHTDDYNSAEATMAERFKKYYGGN